MKQKKLNFSKLRNLGKKYVTFSNGVIALSFFLAIFFRMYYYVDRISIVSDNTRDLSVSYFAAHNWVIPQIGQFSSAGPFFYGPLWYWFLALVSFLPLGLLTHWYVMSALSFIFIGLCYCLGNQIGGRWVGLCAMLFAAVSPSQIDNSFSVWNPSIIPLLSLIALILLLKCFEKNIWHYYLFLGLVMGISATIHFQTILMLPVLLVAGFATGKKWFNIIHLLIGFVIPFAPLIYFDLRFNWFEVRHVWWYLTVGQYNIWVPNRWLWYAGLYWPDAWGAIIGGNKFIGGILIFFLSVLTVLRLKKIRFYKAFYILAVTFVLEIILFRYYRGERYGYYSFFAHPTVIVLSSWVVLELYKSNRFVGFLLFVFIPVFSILRILPSLKPVEFRLSVVETIKNEIYHAYPQGQFAVYGCLSTAGNLVAYPLGYFIYRDGRGSLSGIKIGVCGNGDGTLRWQELQDSEVVKDNGSWFNRSTQEVYRETAEWWKTNPPE